MTDAMVEFIRWAIQESAFAGCDLDGGSVQAKAEALGLIKSTRFDPAIHGEHPDAVYGDPWYVFCDELATPATPDSA